MGTHPIFESDFDCLTEMSDSEVQDDKKLSVPAGWKPEEFKPEDNPTGVLEESKFLTLFPKYREKYLKEIWPLVEKFLEPYKIKADLDLAEGSMVVKTTRQTWDPYSIINARDLIKLMARSVPYEQAIKCFDDENAVEVVKIKNIVRNKEKFTKRRQRLVGPEGQTLKCIEYLTGCYINVQGSTVSCIGPHRGLKEVRKIVIDTMNNKHPAHNIRELMIKRECMKNPKLKNESWDRFLPKYKSKNVKKKPANEGKKKEKKEYTPFPPPQQPSKIDLQLESGEYFMKNNEKKKKKRQERNEKQEIAEQDRKRKRLEVLQPPKEKDASITDKPKKKKLAKLSVDIEKLKERS